MPSARLYQLRHGRSKGLALQFTVVGLLMLLEGMTHCLGTQRLVDVRLDGKHGPAVTKVVQVEVRSELIGHRLKS